MFLHHLLAAALISAPLIESPDFVDVISELSPGSCLFIGADSGLLASSHTLGSPSYRRYFLRSLAHMPEPQSALATFRSATEKIHCSSLDPQLPQILRSLEKKGVRVVVLSQNSGTFLLTEQEQLRSLGLDCTLLEVNDVEEFLSSLDAPPINIVIADNELPLLYALAKTCELASVPCVRFHYTLQDLAHKNFDPRIGDVQLKAFAERGILLSDVDALLQSY